MIDAIRMLNRDNRPMNYENIEKSIVAWCNKCDTHTFYIDGYLVCHHQENYISVTPICSVNCDMEIKPV